jgi:hypothetical protein
MRSLVEDPRFYNQAQREVHSGVCDGNDMRAIYLASDMHRNAEERVRSSGQMCGELVDDHRQRERVRAFLQRVTSSVLGRAGSQR